jgi:hypothetical protein
VSVCERERAARERFGLGKPMRRLSFSLSLYLSLVQDLPRRRRNVCENVFSIDRICLLYSLGSTSTAQEEPGGPIIALPIAGMSSSCSCEFGFSLGIRL